LRQCLIREVWSWGYFFSRGFSLKEKAVFVIFAKMFLKIGKKIPLWQDLFYLQSAGRALTGGPGR
jgi:hypothetical protein